MKPTVAIEHEAVEPRRDLVNLSATIGLSPPSRRATCIAAVQTAAELRDDCHLEFVVAPMRCRAGGAFAKMCAS